MPAPIPALPDNERRTPYTISAQTGPFDAGFHIYGDGTDYAQWVEVWLDGVELEAVTDWTLDIPSGTLSTAARPITDARITLTTARSGNLMILGARRPRRTTQSTEGVGEPARARNQIITDIIAMLRERWDLVERVLRAPPGETLVTLPVATVRANKLLGFSSAGAVELRETMGADIFVDPGAPSGSTGVDGDIYINSSTGDLSRKISGSWILKFNVLAQGAPAAGPYLTYEASAPLTAERIPVLTQDILTKDGANLKLSRLGGAQTFVNGKLCTIPEAGITLSPSGLTPDTLYFIYAVETAGAVSSLEASTTAPATDTTFGHRIKSGDTTRTLVGQARPVTGPAWQDTAAQRFVRTWHNRPSVQTTASLTADRTTASTSFVEINTEIRNEALLWADEIWSLRSSGYITNNTGATSTLSGIGVDDAVAEKGVVSYTTPTGDANFASNGSASHVASGLSEGYHYATVVGRVVAGTGTWEGTTTPEQFTLSSTIQPPGAGGGLAAGSGGSSALVQTFSAITANTSIVIAAGYAIVGLYAKNTTANAVTGGIKIGTSSGGTDVVDALGIGANAEFFIVDAPLLKRFFSFASPQTLHVHAITAWNGANIELRLVLQLLG